MLAKPISNRPESGLAWASGVPLDRDAELRVNAMRLLAGLEADARLAAEAIALSGGWSGLLDLCGRWKMLPALETRLTALSIGLPAAERAELSRRSLPAFVQTSLCVRAGVTALSALDAAGIPCAGFKGLAALAYIYPGPRSRTLQDVDVMIAPERVEEALGVLREAGFERSLEGDWDEYVAFLRNSPGTAGNEAVSLRDAKGGYVDLHWRLGALDVETLLAGAAFTEVMNGRAPLISAGHAMLLSVHHALRNDFVPGDIARDVCDFALWDALLKKTGAWEGLLPDAERWGLTAACAALAQIVAELQGRTGTEPPFVVKQADRTTAGRLAAIYRQQLLTGALNTDLAYVASTRPIRQILGGLAGGWGVYREFMRRSEQMNGEESLPMHQRVWKLGKSLAGLSPSGWKRIRALAREKDRMTRNRPSKMGSGNDATG